MTVRVDLSLEDARRISGLAAPFTYKETESVIEELENLLESHHFKPSRRCSEFLNFVVRETLKGKEESLKERILGVKLFKRESNYDTNGDPVVRTAAGEVRKRIAQHYQESKPGAVRIALPVGTYIPRFEVQEEPAHAAENGTPIATENSLRAGNPSDRQDKSLASQPAAGIGSNRRRFLRFARLSIACAVIAFLFFVWRESAAPKSVQSAEVPNAFAAFWKPFIQSQADTEVIFGELKQHADLGQFKAIGYPGGVSVGDAASPGLSGVGEVMGMHSLDEVFRTLRLNVQPKRGDFFTFDDARTKNLIFLGSPVTNPALRELQGTRDFVFEAISQKTGKFALALVNERPQPGEPTTFFATPEALPITTDYAVIALLPSLNANRPILVLAGITTFGTQAAADFVSHEESLKEILPRLKTSKNGEIEPFEAVISVAIKNEVPVQERIVAVHQSSR